MIRKLRFLLMDWFWKVNYFYKFTLKNNTRQTIRVKVVRRFRKDGTLMDFDLGPGANWVWMAVSGQVILVQRGMLRIDVTGAEEPIRRKWKLKDRHYSVEIEVGKAPVKIEVPQWSDWPDDNE